MKRISNVLLKVAAGLLILFAVTAEIQSNKSGKLMAIHNGNATAGSERESSRKATGDYGAFLPIVIQPEPPYDMLDYMAGGGTLYEVLHSSGSQARHQTQEDDKRFFHTKGNEIAAEWEELWAKDEIIYRGTDTSPGNDEFYTLYENNEAGSAWIPQYWKVGDIYERNPYVVFYRKSDCGIVNSGFHRTWLRFEEYYDQYTFNNGITLDNVVKLAWLLDLDGEPEENYYYAEDYGLVGWGSSDRGFSYISEIHAPGTRPDNNRELISCLNKLDEPLNSSPELNYGPLPEAYARRVK